MKEKFDFCKVWGSIEKNILGKIKEGDKIVLTDEFGNTILRVHGGSFLNIGIADLCVYDSSKKIPNASIYDSGVGLKGGMFIREDGRMCIGDLERTFYIELITSNMIKASLKTGISLTEMCGSKMIESETKLLK